VALIGCGQVVERCHLPALAAVANLRVACLVEASEARRAALASIVPGVARHAELDEALAGSSLDAALIATPPATHAKLARHCLAAGLHVLIEKPMATSRAEAETILGAAERAGKHVAVGFNRRFRHSWHEARDRLAAHGPGGDWGDGALTLAFDTSRWRSAAALTRQDDALGALLDDVVPHQADLLAFLFGRPIVRVRVEELRFQPGQSAELAFVVVLADGGSIRCRAIHAPGHLEQLEVRLGDRILWATPEGTSLTSVLPKTSRRAKALRGKLLDVGRRLAGQPSATVASFARQLGAFAAAARGGPTGVLADGTAGLAACAVGDAIRASAAGGGGAWAMVEGLPR
jgi:predicted dehydrogenase